MPEAVLYPKNEFHIEPRRELATGGFGGTTPRLSTQLKYTFPGIEDTDKGLAYDVDTAVVLRSAGIRNDLNAIYHQITMKGIGSPDKDQQPRTANPTTETAEFIFDQMSMGGALSLIKAVLNKYRYHVDYSIRHQNPLSTDGKNYGNIDTETLVLHDSAHLPNNSFDTKDFDIAKDASGVLLSRIRARMSRTQVKNILADASTVNHKYDRTPRLIDRTYLPDSLFDNWGDSPQMNVFVRFRSDHHDEERRSFEVPLERVERTTRL